MLIELIFAELFWIFIGTSLLLGGVLFTAHALKNNPNLAGPLLYNIWGGVVAGTIVAIFLDIKRRNASPLDYYLILGFVMLFAGLILYMMSPKLLKSKRRK